MSSTGSLAPRRASSAPAVSGVTFGVLSIVLGVLVLVWPDATLLLVAILFGIQLIVLGVLRVALARTLPADPGWLRPVTLVLGVLTILAGIFCLFHPGTSLVVVAILLAVGWLAEGLAVFVQAFVEGPSGGTRAFLVITGIVLVIAGLLVLIFPGGSLLLLTRFAGILLIVIGVTEVIASISQRRKTRTA